MLGLADPIGHLAHSISELAAEGMAALLTPSRRFPRRIAENAKRIASAHRTLATLVARNDAVPAEAEWLLDNYYVVQEVVRQIRVHLPNKYYRQLPILPSGPMAGLPRVYTLTSKIIGMGDASPTEADMRAAVKEYQQTTALTIGEIWAVPIMLRLAVLELLRQLCDRVIATVEDRKHAQSSIAKAKRKCNLKDLPSDAYALCVWEAIREEGAPTEAVSEWTRKHLADPHALSHREFNRQAKNQVSIGNAVTTLRLLNVIDWKAFFEATSQVEALLRNDPGGSYAAQDFPTRDRCRRRIEELAKGSGRPEADVARAVVAAARQEEQPGHVADYLLGYERDAFERQLHYRSPLGSRPRKWLLRHPGLIYIGSMLTFTLLAWLPVLAILPSAAWFFTVPVAALALLVASEIAVGLTNFVVRKIAAPHVLPKLEFATGIPQECATFVVVPTMIGQPEHAAGILERLERHALSNPDSALSFALLTDFADAETEATPGDAACVEALLKGIGQLNAEHCVPHRPRFFVFHRRRLFNAAENCWMGWERKRGKLEEFLRLMRGATDTSYSVVSCPEDEIPQVKYVLTLDADTVLPRDAAKQMIATLAHPLNRPELSADRRRVVAGYAVLQPRVSFLYRTGFRSWFARIFAGSAGVDPYSSASSDTSMDLFARGTFTGKGLLDIDAFDATAGHAFPENAILSHDLIESNYARCALASDIEVFDEFPAKYHSFARREHRWVRGDWQLLPWLAPKVPVPGGGRLPNVLPALERWKVIDNLRRSLVAPTAVVLLILGWLFLPAYAWAWTLFVIAAWLLPTLLLSTETIWQLRTRMALRALPHRLRFEFVNTVGQAALQLAFMADQARLALDAIFRTLHRVFVSHKKLLEWETAAAAEARLGAGFAQFARTMWHSPVLALAVGATLAIFAPGNLLAASPLLLMWFAGPLIAYAVSRPRNISEPVLTTAEIAKLRIVARTTWDFFETYVGPTDNWLPPDNFQEEPLGLVAHRTSPTNVGLYLLAVLTAHDFGYITTAEMAERIRLAFESIDKLEKHRGHILNWYETTTLATLLPAYVSTVDSGNYLACLLALKHGLLEKALDSTPPAIAGLSDTFAVVRHVWAQESVGQHNVEIEKAIEAVSAALATHDLTNAVSSTEALRAALLAASIGGRTAHWSDRLANLAAHHKEGAKVSNADLAALAETASKCAADMSFGFLYNPERELFSIGYNATTSRLDSNHYDLLASEACIASYLAIARGEVPRKHWFRLGRLVTRSVGEPGLISWGGTMFEYLMPRLLLPAPRGALLDQAQRVAVAQQIEYGRELNLPWGISESSYYLFDPGQVYKYQSFGVPGMGLKRGLDRDRVVAPYATLLAVDVDAPAAIRNMARLEEAGGTGPFGFYEALDYTPERAKPDGSPNVVRSYMAHHQGMGLLAIANRLAGGVVRRRLAAEPSVRASDLLLDERVPHHAADAESEAPANETGRKLQSPDFPVRRRITTPHTPMPRTHLLSNGHYTVLVTNGGGGYSRCGETDITRWRPDATTDADGLHIYVRDRQSGYFWSGGYQPTAVVPGEYEVTFAIDKAEIRRVDDEIETLIEITVVPDQDAEVRRMTLTNRGMKTRQLDATSFCEIVLAGHAADAAHPAFGKLFLETEWLPEQNALLCRRRPRTSDQPPQFAFHVLADDHLPAGSVSWESSREAFIGRRRNSAKPIAQDHTVQKLTGTTGAVLDPVFAIRREFSLKAGESAVLAFVTGMAANREDAIAQAQRYHALATVGRAFELAWAHAGIELQGSHWKADDVFLYQRIAGHLMYPTGPLRAATDILAANRLGQSGLWAFGISGDLPILILRLHGTGGLPHVRQLLQAHGYWQTKALKVDLVILLENAGGYQDELHDEVLNQVRTAGLVDRLDRPAGVFVRKGWQMTGADRGLLLAVARVILNDLVGPIAAQVSAVQPTKTLPPKRPEKFPQFSFRTSRREPSERLQFDGGYGGFSPDGLEFVIRADRTPPTPWSNVIANPTGGFLVTDSGGGFMWTVNSQSNRITPWSNDPVSDPPGDAIYIYDEDSQSLWCPTPLPIRSETPVTVRHGQGYSIFNRASEDISSELTVFVPAVDPAKISVLKLHNTGTRVRRLAVAYYAEWVLGTTREATSTHVVTEFDAETGAIFARNRYNPDFGGRVAFADAELRPRTATGDRREFLGRNGSMSDPASFGRVALSGNVGPGLDPCAAIRGAITLSPGEERTVVFVLGQAADDANARRIVKTYCQAEAADGALKEAVTRWDSLCSAVRIETPDPAFDILMNRWLVYQTLSCRLWGRSAFYQSGGAYGFRDQLQDVCALLHTSPSEVRTHILRAARRQFLAGDVQHWWHEPAGNGVRTRFSDDFLWLPYTVIEYIRITGDLDILATQIPYIEAPLLQPDQHEVYGIPIVSEQSGTLFEHCERALAHGWQLGAHGLPLMGGGDWNDGMNTVGAEGRGESVWVAWFQIAILTDFAQLADRVGNAAAATDWRAHAGKLRDAVETNAWDGAWYRRAYFDDGTPLGSASNDECQLDSLTQTWAVIAGGDPARASQGMDAVAERLVKPKERLILLFVPPFDAGPLKPGYIKGYLPGVRENGGQYTHAAAWVVKALAGLGRGDAAHAAFALINPIAAPVNKYRGEPYVVAGDVYSNVEHAGRAGWTWYTGSSSWLYRVGLEDILGIRREATSLRFNPCVPALWKRFAVRYRFGKTTYRIEFDNTAGVERGVVEVTLNGSPMPDFIVALHDDGQSHLVGIKMGNNKS